MNTFKRIGTTAVAVVLGVSFFSSQSFASESDAKNILMQGLLGAGTGALSAEMSGGKAGKGALIGAGTNIIGGALLSFLTGSSGLGQQAVYAQPYYSPAPQPQMIQTAYEVPVSIQPAPVYYSQPQTSSSTQILKQGLLGAGVGAISAEASGGKAGMGALVGAGTNVIGGALIDTLTAPSAPQPVYYYAQPKPQIYPGPGYNPAYGGQSLKKHIIRKYGADGKLISEEEFWE